VQGTPVAAHQSYVWYSFGNYSSAATGMETCSALIRIEGTRTTHAICDVGALRAPQTAPIAEREDDHLRCSP